MKLRTYFVSWRDTDEAESDGKMRAALCTLIDRVAEINLREGALEVMRADAENYMYSALVVPMERLIAAMEQPPLAPGSVNYVGAAAR